MTFDQLMTLAGAVLPPLGALAVVMLNAVHVRNAQAIAHDATQTLGDLAMAMHGNVAGVAVKLAASAPALVADVAQVVADAQPAPIPVTVTQENK